MLSWKARRKTPPNSRNALQCDYELMVINRSAGALGFTPLPIDNLMSVSLSTFAVTCCRWSHSFRRRPRGYRGTIAERKLWKIVLLKAKKVCQEEGIKRRRQVDFNLEERWRELQEPQSIQIRWYVLIRTEIYMWKNNMLWSLFERRKSIKLPRDLSPEEYRPWERETYKGHKRS